MFPFVLRHEYNKNVKGKLGGLDVLGASDNDFVINKASAKVYRDLSKHNGLLDEKDSGKVYEVLSVGIVPPGLPIASVKIGDLPLAFKLPCDLTPWVQTSMAMAMQGIKVFPARVEFGKLNGRFYAEVL